jgi:ribosomal-protein-alanine N-acetyltransferase
VSGAEILRTERLVLREVTQDDAPFVLELLNSRGFIEGIGDRGIRTLEAARGYIDDRVVPSYRDHGYGMWLVTLGAEAAPLGLAGLVRREVLEHPDLGYAFMEATWGRGYAQEAAAGVLRHARDVLGLSTILGIANPSNRASQRVLEKVGLKFVEVVQLPGWDEPSAYFST